MKTKVLIERVEGDLEERVEGIFSSLSLRTFQGKKVLIKPNIGGPASPHLSYTTHPELVRAIVHACLRRGAQVMVGDNPGPFKRNSRETAKAAGIFQASEGCFVSLAQRVMEIPSPLVGKLVISQLVLEADFVINVPIFKGHTLTMITGALKNVYGYVPGGYKAALHLKAPAVEDFAQVLCEVNRVRPPDLHIMDALTVLEGNGPFSRETPRRVDRVLASKDPLALDAVMARAIGLDPRDLPVQRAAWERGLGTLEEEEIELVGEAFSIPHFKMPVTFRADLRDERVLAEVWKLYPRGNMRNRARTKPALIQERCNQCGDCVPACPPGALTLAPYPVIDDHCYACFCCVELCPQEALEVPPVECYTRF